jgi:predicted transcriptional regulator
MVMVNIELDSATKELLDQTASTTGRTPSQVIQELLEENFETTGTFPELEKIYEDFLKAKNEGERMLTLDELKSEASQLRSKKH